MTLASRPLLCDRPDLSSVVVQKNVSWNSTFHAEALPAFDNTACVCLSRPWHVAVPLMCLTVRRVLPRYQHFRLELTEFCYWKGRAQLVRQYGGSLELRVDSVRFFWTGIKEIMHDVTVQVQDWWQRYTQNQPALRELANGVIDLVTMCVSHGTPPPYHSWC